MTLFIDLLGFGIVIPILPGLVCSDLKLPEYVVGIVAAIPPFMQFIFSSVWGNLSDRFGRKPVIISGIFMNALSYILFALTNSIVMLIGSRVLAGIGSGNFSAVQAYVADTSSASERTGKLSLMGAAFGLGFIIGPPIGGYLKSHYGLYAVGGFSLGLCITNLLFVFLFLPESNTNRNHLIKTPKEFFHYISSTLQNKKIRVLFLVNALFIASFSMMQISSPLLWKNRFRLDETGIGYLFGFIGLCSVLVQGVLVRYLLKFSTEKKLLMAGTLCMFTGLIALPVVSSEYLIPFELLAIVTIAIANGCVIPVAYAIVSKNSTQGQQGIILGSMQSLASLARTAGPLLSGFLYMFHFTLPFFSAALIMLFCLFLLMSSYRNL
jgi:MFS family permease